MRPLRSRLSSPALLLLAAALSLGAGCFGPVGPDKESVTDEVSAAAVPLSGAPGELDTLVKAMADAELVLIGEASHGTEEFYRTRAALTQRLIAEHGFQGVVIEGDWPDAYRVDRAVRGAVEDGDPLGDFTRFPTWMWRNTAVRDFVAWLDAHNAGFADAGARAGFYGMDLYSPRRSFDEVIAYLERVDPAAAQVARTRRACFLEGELEEPERYAQRMARRSAESCGDEVLAQVRELEKREAADAAGSGEAREAWFNAVQNARVVHGAERYFFSAVTSGGASAWNTRDTHMAEMVKQLRAHLGPDGRPVKLVIWAHNSHVGDARATERARVAEVNLGQLLRQQHGEDRVFLPGFTTYQGTVMAAREWNGRGQARDVRPALENSYEDAFHDTGIPSFLLMLLEDWRALPSLGEDRLHRAIGVVYLPETERESHYYHARLLEQFDAVIHQDVTRAVEPLD
ncbi:MAG TPA: erythromycin esterase family protein [Myxococcus sp.]|nr:erythromycin esterase family protein [Myxococcus sp.]